MAADRRAPRPVRHLAAIGVLLAGVACGGPPPDERLVPEWMHSYYGALRVERLSPPVASRLMAYATTALYAGLAAADPSLAPLEPGMLNGMPELPSVSPGQRLDGTLAAVAAQRVLIDSMFREALPTTRASLTGLADSLTASRTALGVPTAVREASEDVGRRIGLAMVAWSRTDGFDSTRGRRYTPPRGPGLWVNDAPASTYTSQNMSGASEFVALDNPAAALRPGAASDRALILNRPKGATPDLPALNMAGLTEPYWSSVRPFALSSWRECPIPDPPAYATSRSSTLYAEATEVRSAKTALTPEQRTIALYWADNPGETGTPTGHWLSIASQMVSTDRMPAGPAARIMMLTAVAQADAFIASWGYKFQYNLLRPRTYIRRLMDPAWEPLIPTPPFPEYPSAHSTQSAAAATVLTALLGARPFEDSTSISIGHSVRRFDSFRAAALEAGMSRIYGGIHYPVGNVSGRDLGTCIGEKVIERLGARPAS